MSGDSLANLRCAAIFFPLLSLAACDNFLGVEPRTFVSAPEFYRTEDQINSAVIGAYGQLQDLHQSGRNFWAATEMRSDNTTFQFNYGNRGGYTIEELDEFMVTPTNPVLDAVWIDLYRVIAQSNKILGQIDKVSFKAPVRKAQLAGEAKFLRALSYFHLVRLFGRVPLIVEEVDAPSKAFTPARAAEDQVYVQIIRDARESADGLPSKHAAVDRGRATKGAALTLLGEVYLTRKDYPQAIEQFQKVTALGYRLLPEYKDVFDPSRKNHAESIFEIQYMAGVANGSEANNWIYRFAPLNSGSDLTFGFPGPNFGGWNIPTFDIIRAYEKGDRRKDVSIAFYVKRGNRAHEVAIGDSIPYIKKYHHPFDAPGQTRENWPVYRYGRVLLMLAEALNEVGRTGEAVTLLNEVRGRAGLGPRSGLSQAEFRDAVYHEQRIESAFENHRWFDLKRTGRALEVMRAHGQEMRARIPRITGAMYNVEP
jgi:tetratricopeptide (TPR) repeat protein